MRIFHNKKKSKKQTIEVLEDKILSLETLCHDTDKCLDLICDQLTAIVNQQMDLINRIIADEDYLDDHITAINTDLVGLKDSLMKCEEEILVHLHPDKLTHQ